jgi:hypothetical protein
MYLYIYTNIYKVVGIVTNVFLVVLMINACIPDWI